MAKLEVSERFQPLLALGRPPNDREGAVGWEDYVALLGLTDADAPLLVAIVGDMRLHSLPEPDCYAPAHAWRALGRLRCAAVVRQMMEALDATIDCTDWMHVEAPQVLGLIGAGALPALKRFVPDQRFGIYARAAAADGMAAIVKAQPDCRAEVIGALAQQLGLSRFNPVEFNAFIVGALLDIRAVEAADAISRAYRAGEVEEGVCGTLDEVLAELHAQAAPVSVRSVAIVR